MSDLPAHIRRALDDAAEGKGRAATTAHPDCTCTRPDGLTTPTTRANCQQHKPVKETK